MDKKVKRVIGISVIILLIVVVCGLILGFYFNQFDGGWSPVQDDWGDFGAYVGGIIGTIIGGVSVLLVYITYNNQRKMSEKQNELNSKQLEISKTQLKIVEEQKNEALKSEFENHLFKMLDYQREIYNDCQKIGLSEEEKQIFCFNKNLQINYNNKLYVDRTAEIMCKKINDIIIQQCKTVIPNGNIAYFLFDNMDDFSEEKVKKEFGEIYNEIMSKSNYGMSHYFNHLYQILRYVDSQDILNDNQKKDYIDILKTQMSNSVLYLSLIYGIILKDEDVYNLMDKYNFFENLIFHKNIDEIKCSEKNSERLKYIYDAPLISLILVRLFYKNNNIKWFSTFSERERFALSKGIFGKAAEEENWYISDNMDVIYFGKKNPIVAFGNEDDINTAKNLIVEYRNEDDKNTTNKFIEEYINIVKKEFEQYEWFEDEKASFVRCLMKIYDITDNLNCPINNF